MNTFDGGTGRKIDLFLGLENDPCKNVLTWKSEIARIIKIGEFGM
jgi:hypothetical protein